MINFNKLLKQEILWLYNHNCKAHGHRYTEHMHCFEKERGDIKDCQIQTERVGFLDIETTNLHATFGYIFSYAFKEVGCEPVGRVLRPNEIRKGVFDKILMKEFVANTKGIDRYIVYWGRDGRFDIPFLRTRALHWNLDFPGYRELYVTDAYDAVRMKLRLHRRRLETACEFLQIPCKQHRLNPQVWQRAMAGDQKSLTYIYKHNLEDVYSLEALWLKLERFVRKSRLSL